MFVIVELSQDQQGRGVITPIAVGYIRIKFATVERALLWLAEHARPIAAWQVDGMPAQTAEDPERAVRWLAERGKPFAAWAVPAHTYEKAQRYA